MIANSTGFDFKENEDKAMNYGLSQMPTQRHSSNQREKSSELLSTNMNPAWSFSKEESHNGFMSHSIADKRPDYLEPGIPLVEPNENQKVSVHEVYKSIQALPESLKEDSYLGQRLDTCNVVGDAKDYSTAKREEHSYDLKSELRWPDAEDDLDSSGESDDTVIDAGWRVKSSELDQREHNEDGWVDLHNAQHRDETKKENVTVPEAFANSELLGPSQYSEPQTTFIPEDNLNRALSKTPESHHREGFVDLAETYSNDPNTGLMSYSESESLEDHVEEHLTIEALRALADGTQDWNSESQESSPEVLCPQFGSIAVLNTDFQAPTESFQDSTVGIMTFKGKEDFLFVAPLA